LGENAVERAGEEPGSVEGGNDDTDPFHGIPRFLPTFGGAVTLERLLEKFISTRRRSYRTFMVSEQLQRRDSGRLQRGSGSRTLDERLIQVAHALADAFVVVLFLNQLAALRSEAQLHIRRLG